MQAALAFHLPQVRCKLASSNTLAVHLRQARKLHLHSTCRKFAHLISTCGSKKGVHYLPACRRLHRTCLVWTRTCQGLKPTCHGLAAPTSACDGLATRRFRAAGRLCRRKVVGDMMVADQLTVRRWQIIGCYTLIQLLHLYLFCVCLLQPFLALTQREYAVNACG